MAYQNTKTRKKAPSLFSIVYQNDISSKNYSIPSSFLMITIRNLCNHFNQIWWNLYYTDTLGILEHFLVQKYTKKMGILKGFYAKTTYLLTLQKE